MKATKATTGERRPGAGRPPSGRVQYAVRMRPDLAAALDAAVEASRATDDPIPSRSVAVELAIVAWLDSRG